MSLTANTTAQWTCTYCTVVNYNIHFLSCEVCGNTKSTSSSSNSNTNEDVETMANNNTDDYEQQLINERYQEILQMQQEMLQEIQTPNEPPIVDSDDDLHNQGSNSNSNSIHPVKAQQQSRALIRSGSGNGSNRSLTKKSLKTKSKCKEGSKSGIIRGLVRGTGARNLMLFHREESRLDSYPTKDPWFKLCKSNKRRVYHRSSTETVDASDFSDIDDDSNQALNHDFSDSLCNIQPDAIEDPVAFFQQHSITRY